MLRYKLSRFNPLRNITPERLTSLLDDFEAGTMNPAAMTLDAIEQKDDTVKAVATKRKATAAGFEWKIVLNKDAIEASGASEAEAQLHADALKHCYDNLTCVDALDRSMKRGLPFAFRQIIDAQGKKWSCFETVWRPTPEGLSVDLVHVPLWFFENRDGAFKFLVNDGEYEGQPLDDGAWMIARGDGIMIATAVAWMFKSIPIQDWLLFCAKHCAPAIIAKTPSAKTSENYIALVENLADIGSDFTLVTNKDDEIEALDLTGGATSGPYKELIERQDKKITVLWLGHDLATNSSTKGEVGANAQEDSKDSVFEDDAKLIEETLQYFIDKQVIQWAFGEGTRALANIRVMPRQKKNEALEIQKDQFLIDNGAPVSILRTMERMGREMPKPDEDVFEKPEPEPPPGMPGQPAANAKPIDALTRKTVDLVARAQSAALAPLIDQVQGLLELPSEASQRVAARKLLRDLPNILQQCNSATTPVIDAGEAGAIAAILNGVADGQVKRETPARTRTTTAKNSKSVYRIIRDPKTGAISAIES